jgi:hypothetical protein
MDEAVKRPAPRRLPYGLTGSWQPHEPVAQDR